MRRPNRPIETHLLGNFLTAAARAGIGPGWIVQMCCLIPVSIGELFVAYGVIGYCVLRGVCRGVHMRHIGYAAACLGLPRIEGMPILGKRSDLSCWDLDLDA